MKIIQYNYFFYADDILNKYFEISNFILLIRNSLIDFDKVFNEIVIMNWYIFILMIEWDSLTSPNMVRCHYDVLFPEGIGDVDGVNSKRNHCMIFWFTNIKCESGFLMTSSDCWLNQLGQLKSKTRIRLPNCFIDSILNHRITLLILF